MFMLMADNFLDVVFLFQCPSRHRINNKCSGKDAGSSRKSVLKDFSSPGFPTAWPSAYETQAFTRALFLVNFVNDCKNANIVLSFCK